MILLGGFERGEEEKIPLLSPFFKREKLYAGEFKRGLKNPLFFLFPLPLIRREGGLGG